MITAKIDDFSSLSFNLNHFKVSFQRTPIILRAIRFVLVIRLNVLGPTILNMAFNRYPAKILIAMFAKKL